MAPLLPENFEFENYYDQCHPNARKILTDEIFWLPGDENGPTRGDVGSDALHDFWEWRSSYRTESTFDFVMRQLEHVYGLSLKRLEAVSNDIAEFSTEELKDDAFLYDDYLLAVTFAQFMREGCVEKQLHDAALLVLKRQTDPRVNRFNAGPPGNIAPLSEDFKKVVDALMKMDIC